MICCGQMKLRTAAWVLGGGLMLVSTLVSGLAAFQMPFRVYVSMEGYDNIPLPADYQDKSEWIFARLMYPQNPYSPRRGGRGGGYRGDWRNGGTSWTQD